MSTSGLPRGLFAVVGIAAAVVSVAGCSGSSTKAADAPVVSAASSPATSAAAVDAPTTQAGTSSTPPSTGSGCAGFTDGKNGVLRTFCDGKATATVTLGATTAKLTGGTCQETGGYFTINIGVGVGPDFTGTKPDYFGGDLPDAVGPFAKTSLPMTVGGKSYLFAGAGTIAPGFAGFSATGTDLLTRVAGSVTVTC